MEIYIINSTEDMISIIVLFILTTYQLNNQLIFSN